MKIAILGSRGIPALYGGFETFAEELAVRLVKKGVEVTVYCEAGPKDGDDTYRGVSLVHISALPIGPLTTIIFDLLCLWHARRSFDVVYMLGYGASIFCFIPRLWGSKVWINMDGVEWARSKWGLAAKTWFRLMEAAAMWTTNRVIADAEGILQHLQSRHWHLPPASVIPYGAPVIKTPPDICLLDQWQLIAGKYYLIVCRLEPENNVKEIIKGYLQSESAHPLIVVGSIDANTDYVLELLRLSCNRVKFIGSVYDKIKLQALRFHALAYFHGHTVGGTNPSLLEALGCGSLVIAHDNLFNREVAEEAAIYFSHENDVAERIKTVETGLPEQLNGIKELARERVRNIYNWSFIVDSYYVIFPHSSKLEMKTRSVVIGRQFEQGEQQQLAAYRNADAQMRGLSLKRYSKKFN